LQQLHDNQGVTDANDEEGNHKSNNCCENDEDMKGFGTLVTTYRPIGVW